MATLLVLLSRIGTRSLVGRAALPPQLRGLTAAYLHTTSVKAATPLPITAHGPPPKPPLPDVSQVSEFRRRQKAEGASRHKRFWKEVFVVETPDGYNINLDQRPLKTPEKAPLLIPRSKPLLAHAIALEWTNLRTSADALKSYRIPLTQMSSRAIDLAAAEARGDFTTREDIVRNLIRYLDTDTVLCWAPTTPENLREPGRPTLRELQIESSEPILAYLGTLVWPGLEVRVVDGDKGLLGSGQPVETRETLVSWMMGLDVWRLVGFERVVHATKSFVVGARLVAEWTGDRDGKWGIKEAAEAASIEVKYQTGQWGEVEDTHDVESEDLLRQIGGGWLMLYGEV